jgi:hypothetical protein
MKDDTLSNKDNENCLWVEKWKILVHYYNNFDKRKK